ncbi:MAG: hypothetical protein RJB09_1008, partial [Pseudomonadota bacterium]
PASRGLRTSLGRAISSATRTSSADRASVKAEFELSLKVDPSMGADQATVGFLVHAVDIESAA